MSRPWQALAEEAAALWRRAGCVIALTGAGVSVPSGIPDFRSPGGLWARYDPAEVATIQALRKRPKRVWEFIREAVLVFGQARPNAAHRALAALEASGRLEAVITQNIDNLHQEAGSRRVIEFHGSGKRFYCMDCRKQFDPAGAASIAAEALPWRCDACSGVIRPDFVFFGEQIPTAALSESLELAGRADLAVIVGTSGEVAPANSIPYQVKAAGGKVVEINLGASSYAGLPDVVLRAPAEEVLPVLEELLLG